METYQIRVAGHLEGAHWSDWFADLEVSCQPDGTTLLAGPLTDQGALFGVLLKIRDLNLRLLAVGLVSPADIPVGGLPDRPYGAAETEAGRRAQQQDAGRREQ